MPKAQVPQLREREVQEALINNLKHNKEEGVEWEVHTDGGNIDVQTNNTLYEVKDFRNWKCAVGQVLVYQLHRPNHRPVIYLFGNAPRPLRKLIEEHCHRLNVGVEWHKYHPQAQVAPPAETRLDIYDEDSGYFPSVKQYMGALQAISPTSRQRQMLKAHYDAPEHMITPAQMVRAAGFITAKGASMQYVKLARRVRRLLNWWFRFSDSLHIFVSFYQREGELYWIMHPELAHALEELGWVEPQA